MNQENSLKPLWIGIACMLAGVFLLYLSFSASNRNPQPDVLGEPDQTVPSDDGGTVCIQVITPARNPETGEVVEYPTPCDVPEGWEVVQPEVVE